MNGYILDTNVISELRKRSRGDSGVAGWMRSHDEEEMRLSVLVVAEIRLGVEQKRRKDPAAAAQLDSWLGQTVQRFDGRILPVTLAIADRWARMSVPDPLPFVDGLLAATALEHDLTLVTRNVADVERTGVRVVDPFTAG